MFRQSPSVHEPLRKTTWKGRTPRKAWKGEGGEISEKTERTERMCVALPLTVRQYREHAQVDAEEGADLPVQHSPRLWYRNREVPKGVKTNGAVLALFARHRRLKLAREYVFDVAIISFLVVQIPDRAELLVGQVRVVFDLLIPCMNV